MKFFKSYQDSPNHNIFNRALNYGDGVFETILINKKKIPLWDIHFERLEKSLQILNIRSPKKDVLFFKILSLVDNYDKFVAKIVVFRNGLKRGYACRSTDYCYHIILNDFSIRTDKQDNLTISNIILSKQRYLAGLKHLNRLEQVLASNELIGTGYEDAIMLDSKKNIIETTNKNILFVSNNKLYTPKLNKCGVHGVALKWVENLGYKIKRKKIALTTIEKYDSLLVCNSIYGFNTITAIDGKKYFKINSSLIDDIKNKWDNQVNFL